MAVERLAFEDPAVRYHSYHAAQHVVRYAAVRPFVHGKRVLDIACGEGYGARLLRDWGAREVVGVDLFSDAIAAAQRIFGNDGLTFLVGDAEKLEDIFDETESFDLIVSFETIEHLAYPEKFLASLPRLLASNGAIVISCPNDAAYSANHENPFHLKVYSFEDFKRLTQTHLGPAALWMLGAPLLGEMNFLAEDRHVRERHDEQASTIDIVTVENAVLVPAQSNLTTDETTCSHYVGVWGADLVPNAAISTLSVPSYQEPWKAVGYLNARLQEVEETTARAYEERLQQQSVEMAMLAGIYDEKAALLLHVREELEPAIATLTGQTIALKQEIDSLSKSKENLELFSASLEKKMQEVSDQKDRHYELEISRLRAKLSDHRSEEEMQFLRRRVIQYSENLRRLEKINSAMRHEIQDAETKTALAQLEIDRLSGITGEFQKTKDEWWDPQLEFRAARIAELEGLLYKFTNASFFSILLKWFKRRSF